MRFYLKSNKATPDDNDIFPLSSGSGSSWTDFQVKWSQIKSAITSAISSTFYNKTETDTLLAEKVDTEEGKGLSQNDFTDAKDTKLTGISDGATKTEASTTNGNIKIDGVQTQVYDDSAKADKSALWQDATASGNPVTIKTQSAQAAKSTELTLRPIQDLHGYSKPWAAGQGKNKLQLNASGSTTFNGMTYTIDQTNGTIKVYGTFVVNAFRGKTVGEITLAAGTYKINGQNGVDKRLTLQLYDNNAETQICNLDTAEDYTFTLEEQKTLEVRLGLRVGLSIAQSSAATMTPMIRLSTESDATFAPYSNFCPISGRTQAEIVVKDEDDVTQDTVTRSYGQTVYGGSDNVETGVLSVEWAYIASYNGETITEPWISDRDEYVPNTTPSTGAEVAYKLATPTTTTLTAAQVNLIKGLNNVSTDADGISLTYFADGESLTDADNRITAVLGDFATVEGARASQNYAIGDYLVFNDKFCKASAAIASGEVLAIGTNLTQTTIGAELKAIFAQL